MLRRKLDEAWTDKHGNVTRKLVVEATWVQRRKTTSVGQTKVSVEDVTKKMERRSTDCTLLLAGRKSEATFLRNKGNGSTEQGHQGKTESGKEESRRIR